MKPIKKAYIVKNQFESQEMNFYPIVYYGNRNDVKMKFVSEYSDYKLDNGKTLNYLSARVVRHKVYDLYEYDGKQVTMNAISSIQKRKEYLVNLAVMLEDKNKPYAYIYSGLRGGYWGPDNSGYYNKKINAGVYTIVDAVNTARGNGEERGTKVIPTSKYEHNIMVLKEIKKLQKNLL